MIIAVDAEGGDFAPRELVKGAIEAASEYDIELILIGQKAVLEGYGIRAETFGVPILSSIEVK